MNEIVEAQAALKAIALAGTVLLAALVLTVKLREEHIPESIGVWIYLLLGLVASFAAVVLNIN